MAPEPMNTTTLIILLSVALALVLLIVWLGRRSAAGITTGMTARSARVGGLVGRSLARRVWLRMRQLVAARERRRELEEQFHVQTAAEAAALMGNMKGVFMKIGQIVSFASDAMPEQAQQALRGLQQQAPPMAWSVVREVLQAELGGDLGRRFKSVDEEPLAAASIGQVHRARLLTGEQVVLKVQYPGVDTAIENDLKFAGGIAAMITSVHKNADANAIVAELKERLVEEVDYRRELANQQLFRKLWAGHPLVRIPAVHPEHSTKKVLCQEFVRGLGFYDFLEAATEREKKMAVFVLNDFIFDSMHRFHVFNGDPHPGNYLFQEDGGITFLDFGCIKYFEPAFIASLHRMNRAITQGDRQAFDRSVHELGIVLPGRPYDSDFMWDFFAYHAAPFAKDEVFTFTPDYVAAAARDVMVPSNLRRLNLPPDLIFFNRITFGLNAIFQKLGAEANFHRLYRRYIFPDERVPPSLATVGVQLPERFLETGPAPVRPAA